MGRENYLPVRLDDRELKIVDTLKDQLHYVSRSDVLRQGIFALQEKHPPPPPAAPAKSASKGKRTR